AGPDSEQADCLSGCPAGERGVTATSRPRARAAAAATLAHACALPLFERRSRLLPPPAARPRRRRPRALWLPRARQARARRSAVTVAASTTPYPGPDRLPGAYGEPVVGSMRAAPLSTMRTPSVTYQWRAVPYSGVAYLR